MQSFLKEIVRHMRNKYNVNIQFVVQSWFFPRVSESSLINILIITLTKLVPNI